MIDRVQRLMLGVFAASCIAIGGLVGVVGAAGFNGGTAVSSGTTTRACFPAHSWNAPQRLRPCVRIVRVEEDGSFKAAVSDHDGTVRYSLGVGVPDSYECAQHLIAPRLCQ